MEKETIELVKKMIEDGNLSQEIAEKYCPELKSEDERIRKALLLYIRNCNDAVVKEDIGIDRKDAISWLEKQGEQKQLPFLQGAQAKGIGRVGKEIKGEVTMATIKSYTDLEQSKKLAEILPLESADMCYLPTHIGDEHHFIASLSPYSVCTKMTNVSIEYCTPCWSLAALLGILPEIQGGKPIIALDDNYITYPHMNDLHTKADNLVDACYEMIIKLHEMNLL